MGRPVMRLTRRGQAVVNALANALVTVWFLATMLFLFLAYTGIIHP